VAIFLSFSFSFLSLCDLPPPPFWSPPATFFFSVTSRPYRFLQAGRRGPECVSPAPGLRISSFWRSPPSGWCRVSGAFWGGGGGAFAKVGFAFFFFLFPRCRVSFLIHLLPLAVSFPPLVKNCALFFFTPQASCFPFFSEGGAYHFDSYLSLFLAALTARTSCLKKAMRAFSFSSPKNSNLSTLLLPFSSNEKVSSRCPPFFLWYPIRRFFSSMSPWVPSFEGLLTKRLSFPLFAA